MVPDPVTTGQLGNECLIQTPGGVIVNVTEAGIDVANLGILNATLERFALPSVLPGARELGALFKIPILGRLSVPDSQSVPSGVGGNAPKIELRVNFCHDAPRIFSHFDLAPACLSEKSSWCKIQVSKSTNSQRKECP